MYTAQQVAELLPYLTPAERAEVDAILARDPTPWYPLPGPQTMAYQSTADIIGYGGAAGGGKTDLACGKALVGHQKIMILRRIGTELTGIVDRLEELVGSRDGYNGQQNIWRMRRRTDGRRIQIEFGALPNAGDERKFQGRPHDLLVFDEAANFLEQQVRFLLGWLRSVDPMQRCQALLTFNPPTSSEGRWIVSFFAPWIDRRFPGKRAAPGEIRWAAMLPDGNGGARDVWVDDGRPFVLRDGQPCYEFRAKDYAPDEIIQPRSRTFIPSRITDNPYLLGTGYMSTLQALPEPLRSQMLRGDFEAGMGDDPWQVIPTAWVEAAMARWTDRQPKGEMLSLGVDVARGGRDNTVIARRHVDWWFDRLLVHPGTDTPDGPKVAGLTIAATRDGAPQHIDVIGVGSSPYDFLRTAHQQVLGVNVGEKSLSTDRSGRLRFANLRSELWWRMRELLDPDTDTGVQVALPPDDRLLADLTAPHWESRGPIVYVESREEIIKRIGRSPDWASAVLLAIIETPKLRDVRRGQRAAVLDYSPLAQVDGHQGLRGRGYDPLDTHR